MNELRLAAFGHQPSVCGVRQDSGVTATRFRGWAWRSREPPASRPLGRGLIERKGVGWSVVSRAAMASAKKAQSMNTLHTDCEVIR